MIDPRTVPVRYSCLRQLQHSPAHYLHSVQSDWTESLSMKLGTGCHAMMFEPGRVDVYDGVRSGKKWVDWKDERLEQGRDVILNPREHALARGMSDALKQHELAGPLLLDGTTVEQRIGWSESGRECRGTPDAITPTRLVDLKTCRTAHPEAFVRKALYMNYEAQLAWYRHGLRQGGLSTADKCYLVVVESSPPHCVTAFELSERALDLGERKWRGWWETLMTCESSNEWPGYAQSVVPFDAPNDDGLIFGEADEEESIYAA